ncbi:MAG TPA: hypothetical protein VGG64_08990 [Pirellulales bacterium]
MQQQAERGLSDPPGTASNHIAYFHDLLEAKENVRPVIYARVSTKQQLENGSLNRLVDWMLRILRNRGIKHSGVFAGQELGHDMSCVDRPVLNKAAEFAADIAQPLLTPVRSRFIRGRGSMTRGNFKLPTDAEYEAFLDRIGSVVPATWFRPDRSESKERRFFTRLNMHATGNVGGRPMRKKTRKATLLPKAQELRAQGMSFRAIAEAIDVPHSTLQGWELDE